MARPAAPAQEFTIEGGEKPGLGLRLVAQLLSFPGPDEECLLGKITRIRRISRQAQRKAKERRILRVYQLREGVSGHVSGLEHAKGRLIPIFCWNISV